MQKVIDLRPLDRKKKRRNLGGLDYSGRIE
jgi:hypothetical protein